MIIYFDGGLKKNMIAILNSKTNYTQIQKRKYDNDDYEWDALEFALDYAKWWVGEKEIQLIGDNNQVIRWIQDPININSIIKQKCYGKLVKLRKEKRVIATWVKRNENLAGRCLEYHTSRSSRPTEFFAKWHSCERCVFKSLSDKELSEHFYNEHITNG